MARTIAEHPAKTAVLTERSQLGFDDLQRLIATMDMQLRTRGVQPGDSLVVDMQRGELCIALAMVASLRSLTVIFTFPKVVRAAGLSDFKVVTLEGGEEAKSKGSIVVTSDWFTPLRSIPLPDYRAITTPEAHFVFATSGTTGRPKLVSISEQARMDDIIGMQRLPQNRVQAQRYLNSSPANSSWAMNGNLAVLLAGGSIITLSEHLDRIPQYCDLYRVTHLAATPAVVAQILEFDASEQHLMSLEEIQLGGAFTPAHKVRALFELGEFAIAQSYGSSEVGMVCHANLSMNETTWESGYLGEFHRSDLQIEFFDEDMQPVAGEEGLVGFRFRDSGARSYLGSLSESGHGFKNGVFLSGDVLRREGNSLYFVGRTSNVLNADGEKYALDDIEAVLAKQFGNADIAAVRLSDNGSDQLGICYSAKQEIRPDDLIAVIQARFSKLRDVSIKHVGRLARNEGGKIDRQRLAATFHASETGSDVD